MTTWQRQNEQRWRTAVKAMSMNWTTQPPYHDELLTLSHTLIGEGKYDLAVVVAQMACEVLAEQTMRPLLKPGQKKPWNFNLASKEPLKLYKKLTHDKIDAETFWPTYTKHVERRHKILHGSERANEAQARESFDVARAFVMHLGLVRKRLST